MVAMGSTESTTTHPSEFGFPNRLLDSHGIRHGCPDDSQPSWNRIWFAHDFNQRPRVPSVHRVEEQAKVVPKRNG